METDLKSWTDKVEISVNYIQINSTTQTTSSLDHRQMECKRDKTSFIGLPLNGSVRLKMFGLWMVGPVHHSTVKIYNHFILLILREDFFSWFIGPIRF